MNGREGIISFLRGGDNFLIATHVNPEGDALGSSIALAMALEAMGKTALVYDRDSTTDLYSFLPGSERVMNSVSSLDTGGLSLVLIDCNTPRRAALDGMPFLHTAVIDHHETEGAFGEVKWIEPEVPATGIMVYRLLKDLGTEITRDIAVNLYAAIMVDTGAFRYRNTTPESLRAASELAEAGADPGLIAESVYESWSKGRFRLLCGAISSLEIVEDVAIMVVTREMFRSTGTKAQDTENFSNFPRMMGEIKLSAFFREEEEDVWRVSLRSKGGVNAAKIAEGFRGGGHRNAAGYSFEGDIETAKEKLIQAASKL